MNHDSEDMSRHGIREAYMGCLEPFENACMSGRAKGEE